MAHMKAPQRCGFAVRNRALSQGSFAGFQPIGPNLPIRLLSDHALDKQKC